MEDKKEMMKEQEAPAEGEETVQEKKGFWARSVGKIFHKKKAVPESNDAPEEKTKRTFGQWVKDNSGKIIGGITAIGTAIYICGKILAQNKPGTIDPDQELEPGDWAPEDLIDDPELNESTQEEVTEE